MRSITLLAGLLLAVSVAQAAPPAAPPRDLPPVYVMALPANVSLVAVLPVDGRADQMDLDLRAEVVQPLGCKDEVAGLLKRGGPSLDAPDAWDVVIRRKPLGECTKDASRIGARWTVRLLLPDGGAREIVVGDGTHRAERKAGAVTLDGQPPAGDLPGAPPSARAATLVVAEPTAAVISASRPGPSGSQILDVSVTAAWPRCASTPIGFLGRGDAASRYLLTSFRPLATAPLDGACGGAPETRTHKVALLQREVRGKLVPVTFGAVQPTTPPAKPEKKKR